MVMSLGAGTLIGCILNVQQQMFISLFTRGRGEVKKAATLLKELQLATTTVGFCPPSLNRVQQHIVGYLCRQRAPLHLLKPQGEHTVSETYHMRDSSKFQSSHSYKTGLFSGPRPSFLCHSYRFLNERSHSTHRPELSAGPWTEPWSLWSSCCWRWWWGSPSGPDCGKWPSVHMWSPLMEQGRTWTLMGLRGMTVR